MKIKMLFFLLIFSNFANSQSFEGYISNLPVWFELGTPSKSNTISCTLIYRLNGIKVNLSGTLKQDKLVVTEKNKDGSVAGIFTCTSYTDSIIGDWKVASNAIKTIPLKLYKTDPIHKTTLLIPSNDKLLLINGTTLNSELHIFEDENGKKPKIRCNLLEKGIFSSYYIWEATGAYSSEGAVYHTFDLNNNKEISLLIEIDPSKLPEFRNKVIASLQKQLNDNRKNFSDEDWINAFNGKENYENAFKILTIDDAIIDKYYLKNNVLTITHDHYFGFPHVIESMDLLLDVHFTFDELKTYLKKDSILNNLR